jgi:4-diphosphocytidyl-2-C-methyl-D-erythritol kinase
MPVARVAAQAKVNLVLRVGPRREDGFHDIVTMFQLVDLGDDIVVRVGGAGRTLHVAGPRIPEAGLGPTEKNLAYRAAMAYASRAGWPNGFSIELTKNIPAGGGLGGGSSDAGAVLRALDALSERPLGPTTLEELGATLGSDVPFFVSGSACAFAAGRGDQVAAADPMPARDVVLAIPPFAVATADAYRWLDEDRAAATAAVPNMPPTPELAPLRPVLPAGWDALDWGLVQRASFNDFEPVVERRHAELRRLREGLEQSGAIIARLSGSGSTVFGVFDTLPQLPQNVADGTVMIRTRTSTRVVQVEVRE